MAHSFDTFKVEILDRSYLRNDGFTTPKSARVDPVDAVEESSVAVAANTVAVRDLPETLFPNTSVAVTVISCFVPAAPVVGAETVRLLILPACPCT